MKGALQKVGEHQVNLGSIKGQFEAHAARFDLSGRLMRTRGR